MEQLVKPFEVFSSGSHLVLGEAGTGKTKLIWTILQNREFVKENSINIVLTDSDKRIWAEARQIPVTIKNPYAADISWATNPSMPGIYYCACDYAPRIITFLECLATWAIQNDKNTDNKVRIFIDISSKIWMLPEFIEQINRLHFIINSQGEESPIELWAVLGSIKKLPNQIKSIFACINLILTNPVSQSLLNDIKEILGSDCEGLRAKLDKIECGRKEGFYYAPITGEDVFVGQIL